MVVPLDQMPVGLSLSLCRLKSFVASACLLLGHQAQQFDGVGGGQAVLADGDPDGVGAGVQVHLVAVGPFVGVGDGVAVAVPVPGRRRLRRRRWRWARW